MASTAAGATISVFVLPAVLDGHILHDESFDGFGFVRPQTDHLDALVHEGARLVGRTVETVHSEAL